MSNENFGSWIAVILCIVLLLAVSGSYSNLKQQNVDLNNKVAGLQFECSGPSAQEIADLIVIPGVETPNNVMLERLCELTKGCEYYELDDDEANPVKLQVTADSEDFREELADLVDLDEEYLVISSISLRDVQVRAYSDEDFDEENYEVSLFYKVKYKDSDDDDLEYVYVLVESKLDEGKYDSMELSEVSRSFEFE